MKKILSLLTFIIISIASFGQGNPVRATNGLYVIGDTTYLISADRADTVRGFWYNDDWYWKFNNTDSVLFLGSTGLPVKTNIGGSSSASGPDYSVQFKDPSGGLHGSPNWYADTVNPIPSINFIGNIYGYTTALAPLLKFENYETIGSFKFSAGEQGTGNDNYFLVDDSLQVLEFGGMDSIVAVPLSGSGTRNVEVTATGKLIASSQRYNAYGTSVGFILLQTGTNHPQTHVADISTPIFNEFTGTTFEWVRFDVGKYRLTASDNIFDQETSVLKFGSGSGNSGNFGCVIDWAYESDSELIIEVSSVKTGVYQDEMLYQTEIIITTYPDP